MTDGKAKTLRSWEVDDNVIAHNPPAHRRVRNALNWQKDAYRAGAPDISEAMMLTGRRVFDIFERDASENRVLIDQPQICCC